MEIVIRFVEEKHLNVIAMEQFYHSELSLIYCCNELFSLLAQRYKCSIV